MQKEYNPASIESYVARNNPSATIKVLSELGAPPVKNKADLIHKVHYATEIMGNEAFRKLAAIPTPYRDLILQYANEESSNCCGSGIDGAKSNCSGCMVGRAPSFLNAEGPINNSVDSKKDNTLHYIAIASVVLLAVLTIKQLK